MAQWVTVLAAKSEDLSLIPRTQMVGGKNGNPAVGFLTSPQTLARLPSSTHT